MKSFLTVLLVFSSLSAHAYVYNNDPGNKYHSAPVVDFSNHQKVYRSETELGRISTAILSPVGIVVGGLLGGLASGLDQGGYEGVNKEY